MTPDELVHGFQPERPEEKCLLEGPGPSENKKYSQQDEATKASNWMTFRSRNMQGKMAVAKTKIYVEQKMRV